MSKIQLRVGDLRKRKKIAQKELADALGIAVQTVSKWENDVCMPDISMLPDIAAFFRVSVDELLGLKPLSGEEYIPVRSGEKDYWDARLDYLKACRKSFWNEDYLKFLVDNVWEIKAPVQILDCGCGFGYMGMILLPLLPEGSSYTGIDFSKNMIEAAENSFREMPYEADFICDDFRTYQFGRQYDLVISQAAMRHAGNAQEFLRKMISLAQSGGMVAVIDINREFESDGFYVDGMDYQELCTRNGFRKMWQKELVCQDRDYAVGMRCPIMMVKEGLLSVDVRMNDKVSFVYPEKEDYKESVESLLTEKQWEEEATAEEEEARIQSFLNHGMNRKEAEGYCRKQRKIQAFMKQNRNDLRYLQFRGLLVSYGWKR